MKHVLRSLSALLCCLLLAVPCSAAAASGTATGTSSPVILKTELDTYSTKTDRILAVFTNNLTQSISTGAEFALERKDGTKWVTVPMKDNIGFNSMGYVVTAGGTRKAVYWMDIFQEKLTAGAYRISTQYSLEQADGSYKQYTVRAPFTVVKAADYTALGLTSELDRPGLDSYRDLSTDILQDTSAHVYANEETRDAVLVYQGKQYPISYGSGGPNYGNILYQKLGGQEYLLYTFTHSSKNGMPHRSHVGVFNLTTCQEVFASRGFFGVALGVGQSWNPETGELISENDFPISSVLVHPNGVMESGNPMGTLVYKDGQFTLNESK